MLGHGKKIRDLDHRLFSNKVEMDRIKERIEKDISILRQQLASLNEGKKLNTRAIMQGMPYSNVPAAKLDSLIAEGIQLIDVRTSNEFVVGHIPAAINVPIADLEMWTKGEFELKQKLDKDKPTYVICESGGVTGRATQGCEILCRKGFSNLFNVAGGMTAYKGELQTD